MKGQRMMDGESEREVWWMLDFQYPMGNRAPEEFWQLMGPEVRSGVTLDYDREAACPSQVRDFPQRGPLLQSTMNREYQCFSPIRLREGLSICQMEGIRWAQRRHSSFWPALEQRFEEMRYGTHV